MKKRARRRNPSKEEDESEKEFFLEHININIKDILLLLKNLKHQLTLDDIIKIQRLTGSAFKTLKDIDVGLKMGPVDLYKW